MNNVCDKDETTSWESDGTTDGNWLTLHLASPSVVDAVSIKMNNARSMSYPLAIYADSTEVFRGSTEQCLGYTRLKLKPIKASSITIKSTGKSRTSGQIAELVEIDPNVREKKADASTRLRITELQLIHNVDHK